MRDVSAFTTQRVLIKKSMLNRFSPVKRQWRNNSALFALSHMDSLHRWQRRVHIEWEEGEASAQRKWNLSESYKAAYEL